jgi:hypothetical protein
MLSAYFEVTSSISTSGFAKAHKKSAPKPAPKRKGAKDSSSSAVEASEPDETTAVRHARVRDVDDDLRGFIPIGVVTGSSVTSASGSLVREDIITEDRWEHLWDDKAGDAGDPDFEDDEYDHGEEEDCIVGDPAEEDTEQEVLLLDSMRDPAAEDFEYCASPGQQSSQLNVSPEVFRKSLERKASSACVVSEYSGPRLTLEDDDF